MAGVFGLNRLRRCIARICGERDRWCQRQRGERQKNIRKSHLSFLSPTLAIAGRRNRR
jgi:hypothetical protein